MGAEHRTRRGLLLAIAVFPLALAGALWLPAWWEARELREARAIAGVGSAITPGHMTDARRKFDPGARAEKVVEVIGKPSFAVGTNGKDSKHEIWTYYFADGTMTVNLTDGVVLRVSTDYGPPKIPKRGGGW